MLTGTMPESSSIDNYTIFFWKTMLCRSRKTNKINWQLMSHSIYNMEAAGVLTSQLYCISKTPLVITAHVALAAGLLLWGTIYLCIVDWHSLNCHPSNVLIVHTDALLLCFIIFVIICIIHYTSLKHIVKPYDMMNINHVQIIIVN